MTKLSESAQQNEHETETMEPFLVIAGQPVYFREDWDTGIGGGLWSTGLALARYFQTPHAALQTTTLKKSCSSSLRPFRILELGSGNGFLSMCLAALLVSPSKQERPQSTVELVITDVEDHLDMIRQTVAANAHLSKDANMQVEVVQHLWGQFENSGDLDASRQFDLILGSDLAYREKLYDPLIASYKALASPNAVILLGATMADTTPQFFDMLEKAGFTYERFADHLVEEDFQGTMFGIFVIRRQRKGEKH